MTARLRRSATWVGLTAAAVAGVLAIGAIPILLVVLMVAAFGWWLFKPRARPCPRCGRPVRVGELRCRCGFDFDAYLADERRVTP